MGAALISHKASTGLMMLGGIGSFIEFSGLAIEVGRELVFRVFLGHGLISKNAYVWNSVFEFLFWVSFA